MSETNNTAHLEASESEALAAVLDQIIPPSGDGTLPGAGEVGLVAYIEKVLLGSPDLRPVIQQGLAAVEKLAEVRGCSRFCDLPSAEQLEVLNELAESQPGFVPSLVFHSYVGYYLEPRVIEALGLEARAPFPKGYEVEPTDFSLLDPVRKRGKM